MNEILTVSGSTDPENPVVIDLQQDGSQFFCRHHPTDWFHEVGCEHQEWTAEQLRDALVTMKKGAFEAAKRFYAELHPLRTANEQLEAANADLYMLLLLEAGEISEGQAVSLLGVTSRLDVREKRLAAIAKAKAMVTNAVRTVNALLEN